MHSYHLVEVEDTLWNVFLPFFCILICVRRDIGHSSKTFWPEIDFQNFAPCLVYQKSFVRLFKYSTFEPASPRELVSIENKFPFASGVKNFLGECSFLSS